MDYKFKQYTLETKKNIDEIKIVTLSDLNWNQDLSKYDMDDLIVRINDIIPKYLFILGNITTYNNLEHPQFQEKLSYFFELLSCITRTYLVFGKKDYEIEQEDKKQYTSIDNLLNIYEKHPIKVVRDFYDEPDINILGLNLVPTTHYNTEAKKKKIQELIGRIDSLIDNNKLTVLLTHSDISTLKKEKELLSYFDLILTKSISPISSPSIFQRRKKEKGEENNHKFIIENGGVHQKEEMDFIKIKKI